MANARKAVSRQRAMAILTCIRLGMVTLALFGMPFIIDDIGPLGIAGFVAGGLVAGWFTLRVYTRVRDAEMDRDYVPIDERPPAEQRTIQNRALIASGLGCAALSWMAYSDIVNTAPGESISMWAPMAMMYDLAGPWGAILLPVGIWVALAITVAVKRQKMRAAEAR